MRYLAHLTIQTGHLYRADPRAVDPASIAAARDVLARALASDRPERLPPPMDRYTLDVEVHGGAMLGVLGARELGANILSFGVARRARGGRGLWASLVSGVPADAIPPEPPAPWLATLLHPAALRDEAAMEWAAGFQQCVALAWLERRGDKDKDGLR